MGKGPRPRRAFQIRRVHRGCEGKRVKVYLVFVGIAVFVLILGATLVAASTTQSATTTFVLQPVTSGNYCTYHTFDVLTGGTITVDFSASPGVVDQFVMTADQHATFVSGGSPSYLAADTGGAGTFSASLPSGGTYYVESCHGSGYEGTLQTGTHTMTVDAIGTGAFVGGIVAIVLGVVFLVIALWLRRRPEAPKVPPYPGPFPYPVAPGTAYPGAAPWPSAPVVAGYGTLTVSVQNGSSADETVAILVNGVQASSLKVAAGQTGWATIHPALASPYGTVLRIEAVASGGQRASQEVTVTAQTGVNVSLRVG